MPQIILPVGAIGIPGAWVDCSGLGAFPEGQLDPAAVAADVVDLQSAAISSATVGKKVQTFLGGAQSANVSQQQGGVIKQYSSIPLAFCRAVRRGGSTAGINLNLASTNVGAVGPAGPSGVPVQGTCLIAPGAPPYTFLQSGSRGILSVAVVALNGKNQVLVTFTVGFAFAGFPNANYSVNAVWWSSAVAPYTLQPIGWNNAPSADGRAAGSVVFELNTLAGAYVDPTTVTGGLTILCG